MNIKIIGLGGVGTILADALSRYLNYSDISYVKMTFVDGDSYEKKNLTGGRLQYDGLLAGDSSLL